MNSMIEDSWKIVRFHEDNFIIEQDIIAIEFPLTIILNGIEFSTIICTPTNIRELIIGFLASEGTIRFYSEIDSVQIDKRKGFAYVEINRDLTELEMDHSKRFIGSCCGKSRQFYFKSDVKTAKTIKGNLKISVAQCYQLMKKMQSESEAFQRTGGVHNAALCTVDEVLAVKTDVGRHNTLDKIYGEILQNNTSVHDKLIAFSGRISSEVLLKISKIGASILLAKSAPTDLAVKLAEDLGITTIGFVRGDAMNVYTHPYRIKEYNDE